MTEQGNFWEAINQSGPDNRGGSATSSSGPTGGGGSSAVGSGQWEFDPDQLQAIHGTLDQIQDIVEKLNADADTLRRITPPADDDASKSVVHTMNSSGDKYTLSVASLKKTVDKLSGKISAALPAYMRSDEDAKGSFDDSANSEGM